MEELKKQELQEYEPQEEEKVDDLKETFKEMSPIRLILRRFVLCILL